MRWTYVLGVVAIAFVDVLAGCGDNHDGDCESWRQWGNDSAHAGASCIAGQALSSTKAEVVIDPFVADELRDNGYVNVHYQAPLVDGDDIYMVTKAGVYTPCVVINGEPNCAASSPDRLNSQIWSEQALAWDSSGALYTRWVYDSDWKPKPSFGFEPVFQPALAGDLIAVPGAGGSLWELARNDGTVVRHVQPFATPDSSIYVAGGLGVAPDGTIYYSAVASVTDGPDAPAGWLIAVAPDGTTTSTDYTSLVSGAPAGTDNCYSTYATNMTPLPWPPPPDGNGSAVLPTQYQCGPQVPPLSSTPATGPDGTIYVVSHARYNEEYSYLVALHPDLTTSWAASLRGLLHDGCGVSVASDGTNTANPNDCRVGAPKGVDPETGMLPAGLVDDSSTASPVVLPDGDVLIGTLSYYNADRGHLMKFDARGNFVSAYDFGWDITPAVVDLGSGDYRIITKDNHYGEDANGTDLGPYYISELAPTMVWLWRFASPTTQSCTRQADGTVACVADHPNGFEWCINAPVVDANGVTYANSEDGNAYAINPDGTLRDSIFLDQAEGAAYTPVALDRTGRVFAINNGKLDVLGAQP